MSRSKDYLANDPRTAERRARVVLSPHALVSETGSDAPEQRAAWCEVSMSKQFRKWGMSAIALVLIAGLLAPTASLAWTPTGDKPIDNGDEQTGGLLDAVGDPDDGTSGRPQRAQEDFASLARLALLQFLNANLDDRVVHWRGYFRSLHLPSAERQVR